MYKLHLPVTLLMLLLLSGCASNANLAERSDYAEISVAERLDELDREHRKVALFEELSKNLDSTSINTLSPYLDWLQKKTRAESDTSRYAIMYAAYLWQAGIKDTAETMLLHGQFRLDIDFSRCENQNNSYSKYVGWNHGGKLGSKILNSYQTRSPEEREKLIKLAVLLEMTQKKRAGDAWLCSSIDWIKAMQKEDELEYIEVEDSKNIGKTMAVNATKDILKDASFVTDELWLERREKLTREFLKKYL